jgi:hypothetical protein
MDIAGMSIENIPRRKLFERRGCHGDEILVRAIS